MQQTTQPNAAPLSAAPKVFYSALDGLRGIAAICVVLYHLAEWKDAFNFFPRGDLAVDFFFCLSGFVLAHAYSQRLGRSMTYTHFAITRVIRLYPLLLLSVVIATAYFVGKSILTSEDMPLFDVLAPGAMGAMVLPYFGTSVPLSTVDAAFPSNGPLWSLFFEFFISFVWAAIFAILTFRRTLICAFACAAILLTGGLIHNDLMLGAHTTDFFWGIPRVGVSFFLGLAVYHVHKHHQFNLRWPLWAVCLALILPMMLPRLMGMPDMFLDAFFVFALSPLIVFLGAKVSLTGRMKSVSDIGGELSYPIYVLHFPIFACLNGGLQIFGIELPLIMAISLYFGAIMIGSWFALIWYDRPVRRLLKQQHKSGNWLVAIQSFGDRLFRSKTA